MRATVAVLALLACLVNGGCAIIEKERTNRGGYIDYVLDQHWMQADSKGMRAVRAFAIQVSLARVASIAAKNDSDRQLLAIRIGALTKRFLPIYLCAFDTNPLGVRGAENDPCFYYDSAMVEYANGLFDLAMIALPKDDAKRLFDAITGSFVSPVNVVELLNALLAIARDAITYGRTVGALYRDSVELEVQLWLNTPQIDDRPPPSRVTFDDIAPLQAIYAQRNDNLQAWLAAIAELRARGLEPLPQRKFFGELGGLMRYICDQITQDKDAGDRCKYALPTTLRKPIPVLTSGAPILVGDPVRRTRVVVVTPPDQGPVIRPRPTTPHVEPTTPHVEPKPHPGTQGPVDQPTKVAMQAIDASIDKEDQIIPKLVDLIANSSVPTFGPGTVRDAATQIVGALNRIDAQVMKASGMTAVADQQREYQTIRQLIAARISTMQGLIATVTRPTADKTTAVEAAQQIINLVRGSPGVQGTDQLVRRAHDLNSKVAGGG